MTSTLSTRAPLFVMLLIYGVLVIAYAVRTPAWQNPDEPAHFNAIRQIAERGCCPVIEPGDWDQAYLDTLRGGEFAPALLDRLDTIEYEDHQPPLYYLLLTPIYQLSGGSLLLLRLVTAAIGAGVIVCAWAVARLLMPHHPAAAMLAAAIVAFIPQHTAMMAAVNNDALAECLIGLALIALVRTMILGVTVRRAALLGVVVGLALITKVTTFGLAIVVPLTLVMAAWRRPQVDTVHKANAVKPTSAQADVNTVNFRARVTPLAVFAIAALVFALPVWSRNLAVYGWPDFLGLAAHDRVVVGQTRTADLIASIGAGEYAARAVNTTWQSFWGQLGWMAWPLPTWAYLAIGAWLALSAVGAVLNSTAKEKREAAKTPRRQGGGITLALMVAAVAGQVIYYNLTFVQFQGRYLFPALIPIAVGLAWAWLGWRRLLPRVPGWIVVLPPIALLLVINGYTVWRVLPLLLPGE